MGTLNLIAGILALFLAVAALFGWDRKDDD